MKKEDVEEKHISILTIYPEKRLDQTLWENPSTSQAVYHKEER
jgi:hypothetical protein